MWKHMLCYISAKARICAQKESGIQEVVCYLRHTLTLKFCAGIVEPVFAEYIHNLTDTPAGLDAADKGVAAGAKVCCT